MRLGRRSLLLGAASLAPARALGQQPQGQPAASRPDPAGPPIVFVHGNGDQAASWLNNLWRFESNGFKRGLLFPIEFAAIPRAPTIPRRRNTAPRPRTR